MAEAVGGMVPTVVGLVHRHAHGEDNRVVIGGIIRREGHLLAGRARARNRVWRSEGEGGRSSGQSRI